MEKIKLGSPLFIVREEAKEDLFGVLEKIAEIGYEGVEFVSLFDRKPEDIRKKLDSLGMVTISNHVNVNDFYADPERVIADHKTLDCKYITLALSNTGMKYGSPEFAEVVAKMKKVCGICYENGFTPIYHNHNYEFVSSPSLLEGFMDHCKDEKLCMEPDLGWMMYAGVKPVDFLKKYSNRTPVIHLKDIYARDFSKIGPGVQHGGVKNNPDTGYFEFRPTGYGIVNFAELMPYCLDCKPEWFIADHDLAYERDSYADLKLSYDYLKNLMEISGC